MSSVQVKACGSGAAAAAYLVQAVQSREFPVPLVAGDDALVREFPTAAAETDVGIPPVRVRFYVNGRKTYVEHIPGKRGPLPTEVYEGSLETSANAVIPGTQIQPGLEMVAEIDPEGTLDSSLGVGETHSGDGPAAGGRAGHAPVSPHDCALPVERETRFGRVADHPPDGSRSAAPQGALEDEHAAADRRRLRPGPGMNRW